MCFVLGRFNSEPSPELILVSNRDELYDRQGEPPAFWNEGKLRFVAPRDPDQGGTWFGLNEAGLLVAITNRLDARPLDNAPSRGWLAREILGSSPSRSVAQNQYRSMNPSQYNPHRILFLDHNGITFFRSTPDGIQRTNEFSGLFYMDNHSGLVTKSDRINQELPETTRSLRSINRNELENFAAGHDSFLERESACLHLEDVAGTLSSSLVQFQPASNTLIYRFVQGQPCENSFVDVPMDDSFRDSILEGWKTPN